eukprot:s531_g4.t1
MAISQQAEDHINKVMGSNLGPIQKWKSIRDMLLNAGIAYATTAKASAFIVHPKNRSGNGQLIDFLNVFSKEFGESAVLGQEFFCSVTDAVISNEDLYPFLRCAFMATNLTCGKAKCVDGFARLLTKTDFEKCKSPKLKLKINEIEALLGTMWNQVCQANPGDKHHQFKAFGKACIRSVLMLVGKWKSGRENKEYKDLGEIQDAFNNDIGSKPNAPQASSSAATTMTAAKVSKPVGLNDAKDPMFLAKQSMEIEVGKFYHHKDLQQHVWLLTEIHGDHVVLQAQELFGNSSKTITVKATEITKELKLSKTKAPAWLESSVATSLVPVLVCKEENDRAFIFGVLFGMCKTYSKKLLIQESPSRKIWCPAQVNKSELVLVPMTDKVDKITLKPPGQVYAKVHYGGADWYITPPKLWKCNDGKWSGLVVPFWVVHGDTSKDGFNMSLEMKDVKGMKVQVLSNPKQVHANSLLMSMELNHMSQGKRQKNEQQAPAKRVRSTRLSLVLPFLGMEDAKLSVEHCITMDTTKKSWKIPSNLMKTDDHGTQWLQMRASCFGLCNVMVKDKLDPKSRPTLRDSMGYKNLVEKRNEKVFGTGSSGDALFGDSVPDGPPKKKLKAKEKVPADDSLSIQLDDQGSVLQMKSCSKASDDLVIAYTSENVNLFFHYMKQAGVKMTTEGDGKRSYKKTGKYSKDAAAQDTAGESSPQGEE